MVMNSLQIISIGALLVPIVLSVIILHRNSVVFDYRQEILKRVYKAASADIKEGKFDWQWRYDAYSEVSYNEMVSKFWKKLDSFYPDKSFMEE